MSKLYTKTGDDGQTGLFDGTRVAKNHPRVASYGEVDELNAHVGVTINALAARRDHPAISTLIERLTIIQNALFTLGAELATPIDSRNRDKIRTVTPEMPATLETWIDEASAGPPPLRAFVLPGGDVSAAHLHVCRTVCRRAERGVITLAETEAVNPQVIIYLNRLSDLFFAWSRMVNHVAGVPDVEWRP